MDKTASRQPGAPFPPPPAFFEALEAAGLALRPDHRDLLKRYIEQLFEANRRFNLTAIRDPSEAWMRHIVESLSLLPLLGEARNLADLGSGGGLPGIPLAILRPDLDVALIEATTKKARFLEAAAKALGLQNVHVISDRAENLGREATHRACYDLVVARAVAPLNVLLELAIPLLRPGGRLLAFKGKKAAEEIEQARAALRELSGKLLSLHSFAPLRPYTDTPTRPHDETRVLEIRKTAPTPPRYPRRPGLPAKRPITAKMS